MQMCEMFKTFLALFVLVATVASVPIAPPSISPTISPTIWLTDCVESCEILDDVDSAISAGNIVGRVTMSKYFTISFEFKISALPSGSEVRNIMDIRDTITDDSLVRIGVTRSGNLQSAYNNTVYNAFGPKVLPNIPGPFTECELSFDGTNFMTWTDEDDSWYDRYHINTTEVATAGKEYFIFASNIDPFNPTAGGVIKEIEIECERETLLIFNFSDFKEF